MSGHPLEPPADGGPGGPAPDNRGPIDGGDAGSFDPAHALDQPIVVPDDARDLARDVKAWRREERWRRRRQLFEGLLLTPRPRDRRMSGLGIALVFVVVASVGATISIIAPGTAHPPTRPVALRLAAPTEPPGTAGGLLPETTLSHPSTLHPPTLSPSAAPVDSRQLRPALVAIVGPGCDCPLSVETLARAAATEGLPVYLVGRADQADQLDKLVGATAAAGDRFGVDALVDPAGTLTAAYQPRGLTVVPVHADGVTEAAVRDYSGGPELADVLANLKQAGPP